MFDEKEKVSNYDAMKNYIKEVETFANELLHSSFPKGPSWNIETCCLYALSNVILTPNEVIITADLPNIVTKTVNVVAINSNVIRISAKLRKKIRFIDLGIHHRQGEFSSLQCQGKVDVEIEKEKMKISYNKGILEVRFPRKE
jgi:HSP20 family molecular chaperone IbpA